MLSELRIVEIGEGQAVQVAGLMLAGLGADVLKIERPGGDPARGKARGPATRRPPASLLRPRRPTAAPIPEGPRRRRPIALEEIDVF